MDKCLQETITYLEQNGFNSAEIGVVLGTGLHQFANEINIISAVNYSDIPHFPVSTVESHAGKLIYGTVEGRKTIAMMGRFHGYEGYTFEQITYCIHIFMSFNINILLISNASGMLNLSWEKGDLMLINGYLHQSVNIPENRSYLEKSRIEPFPNQDLNNKIKKIAQKKDIVLREGNYVSVIGPMLETRAEYRYLRAIGADAVGMSTTPEIIVAKQLGIKCVAISILTDECNPDHLKPITLSEIIATANKSDNVLSSLFKAFIKSI